MNSRQTIVAPSTVSVRYDKPMHRHRVNTVEAFSQEMLRCANWRMLGGSSVGSRSTLGQNWLRACSAIARSSGYARLEKLYRVNQIVVMWLRA
jgi:hypothetical protein